MNPRRLLCFGAALLVVATWADAQSDYDQVLYLHPPLATSCLAIEIPTPDGIGLSGLRWWHNDAQVAFPKLVLLEGVSGQSPDLSNAALILIEIVGASLAWGQVDFGGAVTSSTGTAYAVFYYPEELANTGLGAGTGPGIGIREASGAPFYLSGDAEHWVRFDQRFAIGIEPVYASGKTEPQVLAQMRNSAGSSESKAPLAAPLVTGLLAPRPNPFNPLVEIGYVLTEAGWVQLQVFDLRGRLVRTLLAEALSAGPHSAAWDGLDGRGRSVASGSYVLRMTAGQLVQQQRLALVR
jgi:hypothetical protein